MIKIEMKIKEAIEQSGISIEELEKKTGIEKKYLEIVTGLPADEILLHEVILIANALGKTIEDLFEIKNI